MNKSKVKNPLFQKGFSLFEVLIAVVILSVGLLGLAGLQLWGLRYNNDSYIRSQATITLNDLAERMHINLPGIASYDELDEDSCTAAGPPTAPKDCGTVTCNPAELAVYDLCEVFDTAGAVFRLAINGPPPTKALTIDCMGTPPIPALPGSVCGPGYETPTYRLVLTWLENENNVDQLRSTTIFLQP